MKRNERKYTPDNVKMALLKLRILGLEEPMVFGSDTYTKDSNGELIPTGKYARRPFSQCHREDQKRHWIWILDMLREAGAKQRGVEHRKRNAGNP